MTMATRIQAPATRSRPPVRPPARPALPQPLEHALAAVRAAQSRALLGEGTARVTLALFGLVVGQCLLDWGLELSRPARTTLLLGDFILLGFLIRRWLVLPWRRRYDEPAAALAIQRTWPSLGSRIIAAVQLVRPEAQGSRLLINQLIAEAGKRIAPLPIRNVVPTRQVRRLALAAFLSLLGLGVAAWRAGPLSPLLAQRLLLSDTPLPTLTTVVAVSQDLLGPAGGDFALIARAEGVVPSQGRVQIEYADGQQRSFPAAAKPAEPSVFELPLTNVQQSFTYRFFLGDGRGPVFTAEVRPAPLIAKAEFTPLPPPHTPPPPPTP